MPSPDPPTRPPLRAFTQGVGAVFQIVGVSLFLIGMFICCASSLLSKETARQASLANVGWSWGANSATPAYSGQKAIIASLLASIVQGMALAGIGLGLQAHRRASTWGAVAVTFAAASFWAIHALFFTTAVRLPLLAIICGLLAILFFGLCGLSIAAAKETWHSPPPEGFEVLPKDYKIPYSHLHADPPEVRLARELEQRRERLAIEQKELEMLEAKLKHKLSDDT